MDIEGPEEEALHMVAILCPVEAIILPVDPDILAAVIILPGEGIVEAILTMEEVMDTMEGAILIIEGGIPTTEAGRGRITGDGTPITVGGTPTMVAGHTTGGLVPGMARGPFRPGMFPSRRLSMPHLHLLSILPPLTSNHRHILTQHLQRDTGAPMRRRPRVSGLLSQANM